MMLRFGVIKDCLVLCVCPVGELVVTEIEVLSIGGVVLTDEPVVMHESFKAYRKLLDVLIDFVEAGCVLAELELVGTDGGSCSSEGSESDRFHL